MDVCTSVPSMPSASPACTSGNYSGAISKSVSTQEFSSNLKFSLKLQVGAAHAQRSAVLRRDQQSNNDLVTCQSDLDFESCSQLAASISNL